MELDYYDLLSGREFYIDGICTVKSPLLSDIRRVGYQNYVYMCNLIALDLLGFIKLIGCYESYNSMTDEEKEACKLYNLILFDEKIRDEFEKIFSFFIVGDIQFNPETNEHYIIKEIYNDELEENQKYLVGKINAENYSELQTVLLQLNGLKKIENKPTKYRNEAARLLAEKLEKHREEVAKKQNKDSISLGGMISKYCADNKNGINILNVWDMNIFQFYDQFEQHNYIRQTYIQDMIYTNTVTFSDLKGYDSQLWLKNNK
jgi:hypothetical protein